MQTPVPGSETTELSILFLAAAIARGSFESVRTLLNRAFPWSCLGDDGESQVREDSRENDANEKSGVERAVTVVARMVAEESADNPAPAKYVQLDRRAGEAGFLE